MATCLVYVTFLTAFVEKSCESGLQSFGVAGGVALMNWTIIDRTVDTSRYILSPNDNARILEFLPGETVAKVLDQRVSYTGDICRGIVSFTLSGLTTSDAGIYKYMIARDTGFLHAGGQELVLVAVGVRGGDALMTWRLKNTSVKYQRFVKSPDGRIVLFYPYGSSTGKPTNEFSKRLTDIRNVTNGMVFYRLTDITSADVGRYELFISENATTNIDAGGQTLVLADFPSNVTITKTTMAFLNARYTFRCSAASSIFPSNIALPIYYQWKRDGVIITNGNRYTVSDDGTELSIASLQREDITTLTCMAWQDIRAMSETSFYVEIISPDVSGPGTTSSLPLIFTGIIAGIFFIITVLLIIYILKGKSKHGSKTDSESRTRINNKLNEEYIYSSPETAANDADTYGSQKVPYYDVLQENLRDQDQNNYYDRIQTNVATIS